MNIHPALEKPHPEEHLPFHNTYISLTGGVSILDMLEALKDSTYKFFMSMPEGKGDYAYAEGKWTLKQVAGHMIDAERIFAYRILCTSRAETQLLPGFDQDDYVAAAYFNNRTLESLAREFQLLRESNLYLLKSLTPEQWLMKGNVNHHQISVRAWIHVMAGHELHHLQVLRDRYL